MSADNNVIQFKAPNDATPSIDIEVKGRKNRQQTQCKHHLLVVDEENRAVECNDCGCVVDAFDVLLARANNGESVVRQISQLLEQRDELRKSVDGLLREEKNTKARLRSARTDLLFIENKKLQHDGKVG
ncbi:hypothetical protein EKQ45_08720 [Proteus vulgaris]|nr:hypothetical protein EKQ45_08720 [Proteus vulgaris]